MAISGQNKPHVSRSDDGGEYVASFCRDTLFLIVAGYKKLFEDDLDYSDTEEEHITGDLVQRTDEYINAQD